MAAVCVCVRAHVCVSRLPAACLERGQRWSESPEPGRRRPDRSALIARHWTRFRTRQELTGIHPNLPQCPSNRRRWRPAVVRMGEHAPGALCGLGVPVCEV